VSYQITLKTSGKTFTANSDETVLEAALKQGINLPYGCKNGACGSCKGKIESGQVTHGDHNEKALSAEEAFNGSALFCCAKPQSDLVINVREVEGAGDIAVKKIPCRVHSLERVTDDVVIVKLQLPATEKFQFLAGQYIEFLLKDKRRAYSLASAPHEEGPIELHIRHMPGGSFTDFVFGNSESGTMMKEKDILRFEGPLGSFILRESDKPIIFVASGTGFAPVKGMVEHIRHQGIKRPIKLYWGGRRPKDFYKHDLCLSWAKEIPNFEYIPVASDALPEDNWTGRTGFVHQAAMADNPDMSGYQVYACGAPIVVESAKNDFVAKCQLPEDEFYSDAFTSAADLAKKAAAATATAS
jgi:CDP-4-dehydro-6-deoxyglucose reductase